MREFIKIMKALSDPNRVKIIKLLQRKIMCVCEITDALGIGQSTASKHLKVLEEAGLITFQKEGLWVNYRLSDGAGTPYAADMLANLRRWLENDPEIEALNRRLPDIHREVICGSKPSK